MGINEYNKKPQGFVKTFPVNTFGYGEVIGAGDANTIQTGQVLTVNGKSCEFEYIPSEQWKLDIVETISIRFIKLAIDSNGVIHVLYTDENQNLKYAQGNQNGYTSEIVCSGVEIQWNCWIDIACDSLNAPHIAFYQDGDIKYGVRDNGQWLISSVITLNNSNTFLSMSVNTNNLPIITFLDHNNLILKCARNNGSSWIIDTVDNEEYNGWLTDTIVDSNDNIYIAYFRHSLNPLGSGLKCAKFNGSSWSQEVVENNVWSSSAPSIRIASTSLPAISFIDSSDNNHLKFAYHDGSTWNTITIDPMSSYETSALVIADNKPIISWVASSGVGIWKFEDDWVKEVISLESCGNQVIMSIEKNSDNYIFFGYKYNNLPKVARQDKSMSWDEVKRQIDNSEIGTCGLFTITRNGIAGQIDIKINDDYTDCIVERDDTGLFTDNHEIYNGKKRGAKITIPNHWNTNNVPKFTIMNSSNNVDWRPCNNIFSYHPITGVFSFLAMNNQTIEGEVVKNILFKVYAEQLGEIADE